MPLQNTDLLYVQRGDDGFKTEYTTLKSDGLADVPAVDAYTKQQADDKFVELAGDKLTGAITSTEVPITAGEFDLSKGNFFSCGAVAVPTPTGGVNGQSGLIRFTATPASLPAELILPNNFNIANPSVVAFYVAAADRILLGNPVEVS